MAERYVDSYLKKQIEQAHEEWLEAFLEYNLQDAKSRKAGERLGEKLKAYEDLRLKLINDRVARDLGR